MPAACDQARAQRSRQQRSGRLAAERRRGRRQAGVAVAARGPPRVATLCVRFHTRRGRRSPRGQGRRGVLAREPRILAGCHGRSNRADCRRMHAQPDSKSPRALQRAWQSLHAAASQGLCAPWSCLLDVVPHGASVLAPFAAPSSPSRLRLRGRAATAPRLPQALGRNHRHRKHRVTVPTACAAAHQGLAHLKARTRPPPGPSASQFARGGVRSRLGEPPDAAPRQQLHPTAPHLTVAACLRHPCSSRPRARALPTDPHSTTDPPTTAQPRQAGTCQPWRMRRHPLGPRPAVPAQAPRRPPSRPRRRPAATRRRRHSSQAPL